MMELRNRCYRVVDLDTNTPNGVWFNVKEKADAIIYAANSTLGSCSRGNFIIQVREDDNSEAYLATWKDTEYEIHRGI